MNDYLLMGEYGKERMKDLRNERHHVEPVYKMGRANRQSLFSKLRDWWVARDERDKATPKRRLERAR